MQLQSQVCTHMHTYMHTYLQSREAARLLPLRKVTQRGVRKGACRTCADLQTKDAQAVLLIRPSHVSQLFC